MKSYILSSNHAEDVPGGQVVAPGEKFKADESDPHIQRLLDEGKAYPVEPRRRAQKEEK